MPTKPLDRRLISRILQESLRYSNTHIARRLGISYSTVQHVTAEAWTVKENPCRECFAIIRYRVHAADPYTMHRCYRCAASLARVKGIAVIARFMNE